MSDRMDICVSNERNGKTYYNKIGIAFPTRNGGWSLKFFGLPPAGEAVMFPQREKQDKPSQSAPAGDDFSDEIPF